MSSHQDVIWISLESVGAKHTSLHGDLQTTPRLEQLAEEHDGVVFERCFSASMWTPPSTASILTGTRMSTHNIGLNGHGNRSVPSTLATVPELLQQEGYRTMCTSPNPYISSATGLDRGFDDFYQFSKSKLWKTVHPIDLFGYLRRLHSIGPGLNLDYRKHNLSWFLVNRLRRWLNETDGPRFVYSHVGNPHHPYCPPLAFREQFADEVATTVSEAIDDSFSVFGEASRIKKAIATGDFDAATLQNLEAMYHGEIYYADYLVGKLLEEVLEELSDTIVVVTADHGDCFGEQGVLGHNLVLDDALTHVPAVVFGLDSIKDSSKTTSHIDLMRTVLNEIGVNHEQFEGTDLRFGTPEFAVSQRGRAHFEGYLEHNAEFETSKYHKSPLTAVRTSEYKLLYSDERVELFELPDERSDVSASQGEKTKSLKQIAREFHFEDDADESVKFRFDNDLTQQLEDLGYI
ncbi:sulfatase-like hydrolase/transferase [Halorubrum halodurans]|uniref:Sulfatase N-terminal domain-containing protein n=1 Tax=Halorubrum halodurans TaxID=1383851 RepID=A0A256IGY6_9EURY|nr:sulfatase-like hydrolase/transferase [Halorubrum halodurans]OYR55805.1 hypothetical protein DJ70_10815 [Halorubrum halodurans]